MRSLLAAGFLAASVTAQPAPTALVEAESFATHGGWRLDTQFVQTMGSPYLLAHGLGVPVKDATTTVTLPRAGRWWVFVRTLDWVGRWKAPGKPGRFQLLVDGQPLATEFGTANASWHWQRGGAIDVAKAEVRLALRDRTGFDGRCDAILFAADADFAPPEDPTILPSWRRELLGLPAHPEVKSGYDLVVVGGGYSGMGAALAAARLGCRVALIQDRFVLGGNGSSEVRVWANGYVRRGRFPRIGEIVAEFADHATRSPGTAAEFGDALKEKIVRAEPGIDLFLGHHAYAASKTDQRITSVTALDVRSNARREFRGSYFVDCTGHGTLGFLAGAAWEMTPKGRMGMSNMWTWAEADQPRHFPKTPWALPLTMRDFPYPRDHHGQWFWESGFDKDPLRDAEAIRDWNLRAVFGAFQAMKNGEGAARHSTAYLTWIAYIGGPRESRRLLGDVVLTQDDVVKKRDFDDGCVPSTWTIDLHYPRKDYAAKFPDNPFIAIARHDRRIDRQFGYPVPYRCFYSRDVDNLFMAGRCISVSHEALGTVRVMKTCGMMGEVVGRAASICAREDCTPRDVYRTHLSALKDLLQLPGKARRATLRGPIHIPPDALPAAGPRGPITGRDPRGMRGVVVDDVHARRTGKWTRSAGVKGYVGYDYLYAAADSGATLRFPIQVGKTGDYEIRLFYGAHPNRGSRVAVRVHSAAGASVHRIDMRKAPGKGGFIRIGRFTLTQGRPAAVELLTKDAGGTVHGDAIQVVRAR